MQLEDYFDFLTEPVEQIRLKGTRIGLEHVVERYLAGIHPDRIAADYRHLVTADQVYAALTYYHRNKDAVEAYFARGRALFAAFVRESQTQPESDAVARIKAIKAAWASVHAGPPS